MQIDICTNYRFQGNLLEIITVYNRAISQYFTNGPNASELHHIMSNQIQYCSGNSAFFFSINHEENDIFELCITINKPCLITAVLEGIFEDNNNRKLGNAYSGNTYYQEVEKENEKYYASLGN
jgi:hypothetical protein